MSIEDLFDLVAEHGVVTALIVVVIFVVIMLAKANLLGDVFKGIGKKIKDRKDKKKKGNTQIQVKESDIINHEIFNLIDFWVYSKIPTIQLRTDFRTAVFQRYLHIYFKSYKDVLHICVNDGSFKELDNPELRQFLLKIITDIVFDYETEMRRSRIPEIVITRMKAKNNDTLNLTIDLINSICDSNFYNSEHNLLKVYSFLNIVLSILENTMSHCEEVSDSINGELKGLKYGGFQEP
ncbi:MAG: hypothetical protein SLAVMIC_00510 [uncultured marine phage]|uniref:Uncharacterized protein n=1 Tax=uncultured marine phage TaxID=707152 RepID=A0A8D9FRL6_9VIRU|nr:MAG: hypothetical protein SLAVMIC_00510 [uncultured marine phage]